MKINKNPTASEVRRFALSWMTAAGLMGALLFWRHHSEAAKFVWGAAVIVGFSGAVIPVFAKGFYRLWMGLAFAINYLITHLLLAFIFLGVLTPLALLFKIVRRDALGLKKRTGASDSYWHEHDKINDTSAYQHLY